MCLYCLIGNSKAMQVGLLGKRAIDRRVMQLDHLATPIADEQLHRVGMIEVTAENEGVERLHLVGKALFEQEVERPIDGRRFGMSLGLLQLGQQIIGTDGIAVGGKQPEHLAPCRGETDPALLAEALRTL